ncbi:MAG: bifunctional riboflavin kinase/FMN adenylyltransferase, partial [Firmicutes bacterium]|nr:bifunctional riboflavin kinase/FMN adenylyltransferase [Bacillota bacterium]
MIVFNTLEDIKDIPQTSLALGNFDGVHLGHQAIIREAVSNARKKTSQGIPEKSAVFTFSTHPKNLIPGAKHVENIIYADEKRDLIESLGVDYYFDIEFTENIMTMDPENYVRDLLVEKFNAKDVFCGFNYRFGYKAGGNTELLTSLGEELGFKAHVMPPVMVDGEVVSSTLIRELIRSGDIDECDRFLGRNYTIGGEVVVGNRLGKSIGFPTSNIMIDETMVTPPNGVYITYLVYNGVRYPSVTNVGVKPTVGL